MKKKYSNHDIGIKYIFFVIVSYFFLVDPVFSSDVFITVSDEFGQGILRQRGSECLIVTPSHVVNNEFEIEVTLADRSKYKSSVLERFPGDIALLRFDSVASAACSQRNWSDGINLNKILEVEKQGELRAMLGDGSIRKMQVDIISYDKYRNIIVRPVNKSDVISKGDSGSLLYIAGQLSGMLLSVEKEYGNVLRQDNLDHTLAPFFKDHIQAINTSRPEKINTSKEVESTYSEMVPLQVQEFSGVIKKGATAEHRMKLEANSPIRLNLPATGDKLTYHVEILDSKGQRHFQSPYFSVEKDHIIPFTPKNSDIYIVRILGQNGEGKYAIKIEQIALDSQLRGKANVLEIDGNQVGGVLAAGATAEHRMKLEANSPIRLNLPATGDKLTYHVEILDSKGQRHFQSPYFSVEKDHIIPFTPKNSDIYIVRILGQNGEGKYAIKIEQIALDSQLRGKANVLEIDGNQVGGVLAAGATAEHRMKLEANSPIRLNLPATGDKLTYHVEILDSKGQRHFQSPYFSVEKDHIIPFTPKNSDIYIVRILGQNGEGKYAMKVL